MDIETLGRRQTFLAMGTAALLFALCFGGTPALRFLLGLLVGVAGFASFRESRVDKPVALLMALWVAWCFATVAWSAAPIQSLRAAIEEALLPAGCFLAAMVVARSDRAFGWAQAGQFGGLAVLFAMTVAIFLYGGWTPLLSHEGRPWIFSSYPGTGVVTSHFVLSLPFMAFWIRHDRRGKVAVLIFAAMSIVVGVLAENRMYWLTLMAVCAAVAILFIGDLRRHLGNKLWPGLLLLLLALSALLAQSFFIRATEDNWAIERTIRSDSRWHGWRLWIEKGMQHPLGGVGFGKKALRQSLTAEEKHRFESFDGTIKGHPHNFAVTTWVTTGTVGLIVNMALFAVIVGLRLIRRRRTDNAQSRDACAVGILLVVALFAKNLTDDQISNAVPFYFWTLLGLAYGRASLSAPSSRDDLPAPPAKN